MFRHATEWYYQNKIERLEAKILELQERLAQANIKLDDSK